LKRSVTTFDYIKDILVDKKGNLPLDNYVPFLINRFLSFINPEVSEFINQANTKVLLEDKLQHYKLLLLLFPKLNRVPFIKYVKKVKEKETEEDNRVKVLAQNMEISEKEALWLIRECSAN